MTLGAGFDAAPPLPVMTTQAFVNGLHLRHFAPREIFYLGGSNHELGTNYTPPEELWENIVQTAWIADAARALYGSPIRVLSGYRSPEYNLDIGGASRSQHKRFTALDLGCDHPLRLYNILVKFRTAGVFKGGIGRYSSFVHVDTRGSNATWRG